MKILIILILTFAFAELYSQNDTLIWSSATCLTADDFKAEAMDFSGLSGEAYCVTLANFERLPGEENVSFKVVPVFHRDKSWLSKKTNKTNVLLFFQSMFNLYELHARLLRKKLSNTVFDEDPNPIFQKLYSESMSELMDHFNNFKRVTKMGIDIKTLKLESEKIKLQLLELEQFKR